MPFAVLGRVRYHGATMDADTELVVHGASDRMAC